MERIKREMYKSRKVEIFGNILTIAISQDTQLHLFKATVITVDTSIL